MSDFDLPHAIVFGSRSFDDWDLLEDRLDYYLGDLRPLVVASGGARGADRLGERWAAERRQGLIRFLPDWKKGPSAGPERNERMAVYVAAALGGGYAVAFWDGASTGTADMIARCRKHGIKLKIVRF